MITTNLTEREEIEQMLPWYEKGALSAAEARRVERYLAAHPQLRDQLILIREEIEETISANETIRMPSSAAHDRLMAQIAAETPAPSSFSQSLKSSLWRNWLTAGGMSPGALAAAGLAALIIVAQAIALILLVSGEAPDGGYRVASGQSQLNAETGSFVLVRFAPDASAQQISDLLLSVEGQIVEGPRPGGVFKLRISTKDLPKERREAILSKLRENSAIVTFAAPSG